MSTTEVRKTSGATWGDIDNDGGNLQHWLRVDAAGSRLNRTSLGAWITVDPDVTLPGDTMVWEVNAGSHFLGQSDSIAHFGLGDRTANIDLVEIRWPSGQITQYRDVPVNSLLVAVQPVPEPASVALIFVGVLVWTLFGRCIQVDDLRDHQ